MGAAIGATRLAVSGDSEDFALIAAPFAEVCAMAAPLGIAVDIALHNQDGVLVAVGQHVLKWVRNAT